MKTEFPFEKNLHDALLAAIRESGPRPRRRRPTFVLAAATLALVAAGVTYFVVAAGGPATTAPTAGRDPVTHGGINGLSPRSGCNDMDETTIQGAIDASTFVFIVPHHDFANPSNVTAICATRDGRAVWMDFPPLRGIQQPSVRQDYIEIYESAWTDGDVAQALSRDLEAAPDAGKHLCEVGDLPALCVEPNSPSDVGRANPAFVRFVARGTEIQISGGTSVDQLIDIATSMDQAP